MNGVLKLMGVCSLALSLIACASDRTRGTDTSAAAFAADVERFIASDRAAAPVPCQVLFVGSSSIVYWRTLAADMAPMPVVNRGFGGSQISDVNYWFEKIVAPYRPRAIVFYAGENDIAAGKTPKKVAADFDVFMDQKSRALGQTPVYFISLKPSMLRFEQITRQAQVNAAIQGLARSRADLHYIDVAHLMLEGGQLKDLFMSDNLHMRPEGYALWTRAVRAAILSETESQAEQCRQTLAH